MAEAEQRPAFIGVDWGTSSFRAWLFDDKGGVLDLVQGPFGIRQITDQLFEKTLRTAIGSWLLAHEDIAVIMCGMIGSAQGWYEAGYLSGQIGVDELSSGMVKVPDTQLNVMIVPGIRGVSVAGLNDVVRGEETLLAGWLQQPTDSEAVFCLPGTHSKWIVAREGQVNQLTTFMTGELFELMRTRSILAPLIDSQAVADTKSDIFCKGLTLAQSPVGLLHQMFAIRAGALTGQFAKSDVLTLLSGVLVGAECLAVKSLVQNRSVTLMSSGDLKQTYQNAFEHFGFVFKVADSEQAAHKGLFSIFNQIQQG
ncbi:MAG: 2-dehydro-3-deoxygalactonokinase [Candidatus Puniceispirillaceae bacterium]